MMKFVLAAVGMLALGAAPAVAADLGPRMSAKAPPMEMAATDWSGFYLGANGGGAWSRKCSQQWRHRKCAANLNSALEPSRRGIRR